LDDLEAGSPASSCCLPVAAAARRLVEVLLHEVPSRVGARYDGQPLDWICAVTASIQPNCPGRPSPISFGQCPQQCQTRLYSCACVPWQKDWLQSCRSGTGRQAIAEDQRFPGADAFSVLTWARGGHGHWGWLGDPPKRWPARTGGELSSASVPCLGGGKAEAFASSLTGQLRSSCPPQQSARA